QPVCGARRPRRARRPGAAPEGGRHRLRDLLPDAAARAGVPGPPGLSGGRLPRQRGGGALRAGAADVPRADAGPAAARRAELRDVPAQAHPDGGVTVARLNGTTPMRLIYPALTAAAMHALLLGALVAGFGGDPAALVCASRPRAGSFPYEHIRPGFDHNG